VDFSRESTEDPASLLDLVKAGQRDDPIAAGIMQALLKNKRKHPGVSLSEYKMEQGLLFKENLLYVPDFRNLRTEIISQHHDAPLAGHPGRDRTFWLVNQRYHWPLHHKDVAQFVANCVTCKKAKPSTHRKPGLLC
jgi:hypothetical protein